MANRLTKIVTRTGDTGTTGLGDGSRTSKGSPRIATMGEVDELNSAIGVLLCEDMPSIIRAALVDIQHDLFDLGGELCLPGMKLVKDEQVVRLETLAGQFNADLAKLKEFILPGGCRAAALAHLCRTICRRAERSLVHLAENEAVSDITRRYINRLSDLLFILGRALNLAAGQGDTLWQKGKNATTPTPTPRSSGARARQRQVGPGD